MRTRSIAALLAVAAFTAACSGGGATTAPGGGPGATPAEPGATLPPVPDQPLEDVFPDTIGGQPVDVTSASGASAFQGADPENIEELEQFLAGFGKSVDDLSYAFAFVFLPNPSDPQNIEGVSIFAFRVKGVPGAQLVTPLVELSAESQEMTDPQVGSATIAGKQVTTLQEAGAEADEIAYLYPVGDAVFQVVGTPMSLVEETFSKLP